MLPPRRASRTSQFCHWRAHTPNPGLQLRRWRPQSRGAQAPAVDVQDCTKPAS